MHRLVLRLLLIAGLVVPTTALLSAAPVGAAAQSCNVSHDTQVTPGLEQPVPPDAPDVVNYFKGVTKLTGCVGNPGDPTSGSGTVVLHSLSPKFPTCADLQTPGSTAKGTAKVTWNTAATSSGSLTVTVDAPFHGKLSGKVTAGLFVGRAFSGSISFNVTAPPATQDCSDANPVKHLTGTGTLTLT